MGGIFGTISKKSCVADLFYGTDYNSHLGTRRGGMAMYSKEKGFVRSIHNLESSYFRTKFEPTLDLFEGSTAGIGVISDTDAQPLIINSHLGRFAICTVAKIANINELTDELLSKNMHFAELSQSSTNQTELVALLLRKGRIAYLTDILKEYDRLSALQRGEATAWVRSASELSEQQRMKLQKVLEKKTNRKITLQVQVEPELLGGMVVRLGDQLYDNSVRSRLEKMRVHLQSIHLEGGEKVG